MSGRAVLLYNKHGLLLDALEKEFRRLNGKSIPHKFLGYDSLYDLVNNMPDVVNFEDEAGVDGDKAIDYTRTLKIEYDPQNVKFWFIQLENEMFTCEVKSQWLKRCV